MATRRRWDVEVEVGRRRLDRARVVDAAARVLGAAGLAGFTLRNVAEELGAYVNSVTHHAGSREELLRAVVDRELAAVAGPGDAADVARWAAALRATLLARPDTAAALAELRFASPALSAVRDRLAAVLPGGSAQAWAVLATVLGFVTVESATADAVGPPAAEREAVFTRLLGGLVPPG